jgi:hypothetical protein
MQMMKFNTLSLAKPKHSMSLMMATVNVKLQLSVIHSLFISKNYNEPFKLNNTQSAAIKDDSSMTLLHYCLRKIKTQNDFIWFFFSSSKMKRLCENGILFQKLILNQSLIIVKMLCLIKHQHFDLLNRFQKKVTQAFA